MFIDIHTEEKLLGRVVIGLFGDLAPKAVKNFKVLATTGINGKSYKGTRFNRIIKRFMVQGESFLVFCFQIRFYMDTLTTDYIRNIAIAWQKSCKIIVAPLSSTELLHVATQG